MDLTKFDEAQQSLKIDFTRRLRSSITDEEWESLIAAVKSERYSNAAITRVITSWLGKPPHSSTIVRFVAGVRDGEIS